MVQQDTSIEPLLAELTDAAYSAALRRHSSWKGSTHDYEAQQSFLDLELAIWKSLRRVLERRLPGSRSTETPRQEITPAHSSGDSLRLSRDLARELTDASLSLAGWTS